VVGIQIAARILMGVLVHDDDEGERQELGAPEVDPVVDGVVEGDACAFADEVWVWMSWGVKGLAKKKVRSVR